MLIGLAVINTLCPLDGTAQILLFAVVYGYVWKRIDTRLWVFFCGILFFAVAYVAVAILPEGYYFQDALSRLGLVMSSIFGVHGLNLGYTYQGIGSVALFLCMSICLWNRMGSAIITMVFLLCMVLLNALTLNYLLSHVDFSPELIWTLKYREYFGWRELASHYRQLSMLYVPTVLFFSHLALFLAFHHRAIIRIKKVANA